MIKSLFFLILTIATLKGLFAQTSVVNGNIGVYGHSSRQSAVKVIFHSFFYSDSIVLNGKNNAFAFKQMPYGVYELKIDANSGQTGLKNFVVEDILVNKDSAVLDTVFLFPVRTCGDGSGDQMWTSKLEKKNTKEYYPTGELWKEGNYFINEKYFPKYKEKLFSFQKDGLWKYYYKSGKLLSVARYKREKLDAVVNFYENGSVKSKGFYKTCKSGDWLYFTPKGEILFRVEFIDKFGDIPTMKVKYEYLKGYSQNYKLIEE